MGGSRSRGSSSHDTRPGLAASFPSSSSPLAERYLAQDIAECSDDEEQTPEGAAAAAELQDAIEHYQQQEGPHFRYRRPSGVAYGGTRPVLNPQSGDDTGLSALERKQSRNAERSLLRDNHILPPKHQVEGRERSGNPVSRLYHHLFSTKVGAPPGDEEGPNVVVQPPDETAPLLGAPERASSGEAGGPASVSDDDLDEQWVQAVTEGRIRTTWQRETKTLVEYSAPLIATFFLQYSINVASIFAVGRIGVIELGAVSCKSTLPPP